MTRVGSSLASPHNFSELEFYFGPHNFSKVVGAKIELKF